MASADRERAERVGYALSLLRPFDIEGARKARVGRDFDGGYVLLTEPPALPQTFLSFGIADEVSFEQQLASYGCRGFLFDHTVSEPPGLDHKLLFHQVGLAAGSEEESNLITLDVAFERCGLSGNGNLLKLDIEGAEYAVLGSEPASSVLDRFSQIAVELHWLSRLEEPEFYSWFVRALERLNREFTLCHVHGNNCVPLSFPSGFATPGVLELTYVRSDLVRRIKSTTSYPTSLDRPNEPSLPDHRLDFYPYAPERVASDPAARAEVRRTAGTLSALQPVPGTRSLNILYFACHETLEFDDLRMFTSMGHRVFSVGGLADPSTARPATRPVSPEFFSEAWWRAFADDPGNSLSDKRVSPGFADRFDVAIVNHDPTVLANNFEAIRGRPIVYRAVGQSNHHTEAQLAPYANEITIIRYSDRERHLPENIRTDGVIYFGKSLADYPRWAGSGTDIVTFHNDFPRRAGVSVPTFEVYRRLSTFLDLKLYGFSNEGVGAWRGLASSDRQLELYRTAGTYFYVYSVPPSYTLSLVEAMLVGTPILAPSARAVASLLGDTARACGFSPDRYEVPALLGHDEATLWDRPDQIPGKLRVLREDRDVASTVSSSLRERARALFDVEKVSLQWQLVLSHLTRFS